MVGFCRGGNFWIKKFEFFGVVDDFVRSFGIIDLWCYSFELDDEVSVGNFILVVIYVVVFDIVMDMDFCGELRNLLDVF